MSHRLSAAHPPRPALRLAALGCAFALTAGAAFALTAPAQNTDATFATFRQDAFGTKPIEADSPLVVLNAPIRAEDAALVPIDVQVALPAGDPRSIAKLTLIVDENPAPVAATFTLGQTRRDFTLSTRLRVNAYSSVRAVVETDDGQLHMAARYVKASGGCSAPALKDADAALARIGEMRFRSIARQASEKPAEANSSTPDSRAQLMIRHPNYSGLQMDQIDRTYIPARFVNNIVVKQGDETVFTMEGGISLSEDPAIQFSYLDKTGAITVNAADTEGAAFSGVMEAGKTKSGDVNERNDQRAVMPVFAGIHDFGRRTLRFQEVVDTRLRRA